MCALLWIGISRADGSGLGGAEAEVTGQRGQGPTPVGVRLRIEEIAHQHKLGVARSGQAEAIEQAGEGAHGKGM